MFFIYYIHQYIKNYLENINLIIFHIKKHFKNM
jgi:hypothetical protein